MPERNSGGSSRNRISDGNTSQKIWPDSSAMRADSTPSACSQTNASSEVSGSDATSAAKPVLRFAISAIAAITIA